MARRLAHNKAVKEQKTIAGINYNGWSDPVEITVGHLDNVSRKQAREFAQEHSDEVHEQIDQMKVNERGGDGIGEAIIEDGKIVDWQIYGNYTR